MTFTVTGAVEIRPMSTRVVEVELGLSPEDVVEAAGAGALLDAIGAKDIVSYMGADCLLAAIDKEDAMDFFGIVPEV